MTGIERCGRKMAKISDEIRDYGRRLVSNASPFNCTFGDIRAYQDELADRIDAEMVELPKSADGKIWTGREVCFWTDTDSGAYHRLYALVRRDGRWYVEDTCGIRYPAESVWYERPDSFERIADELDELVDAAGQADDMCEMLANFADRIRKLAKKEDKR